ncbi:MAG: phosphoserine phosphatase SerB [Nitriliruptorales bacterium]|nr:phosphoserine phosphatase SerB [Nitriliruptorales bacterium]
MADLRTILMRVSGRDRPGITATLLGVIAGAGVEVYDMEQVVVRERLTLDILLGVDDGNDVLKELLYAAWELGVEAEFEDVEPESARAGLPRHAVTVVGLPLKAAGLEAVTRAIATAGGNIDRIERLSRYPVISFEFVVVDGEIETMRRELLAVAATHGLDVAVQPERLERRAKRLVMLDVDSTLIQDEVIDLLADVAGHGAEVSAITARAMAGELDFQQSLEQRVALLAGTPTSAFDEAWKRLTLTPGARTFVRTLKRLGYRVGIVSGGFQDIADRLAAELGLDHAVANVLEQEDGVLTGRLAGPIVDRARKAEVLREIAEANDIPMEQTVAVGDGANDLDMLGVAGLGIAFNAKPVVNDAADASLSVPYLDAILFLLGIRREEVERADASDPDAPTAPPPHVPGTPPV